MAIDEMEPRIISVAVPLRERSGKVVAAISFACNRSRGTPWTSPMTFCLIAGTGTANGIDHRQLSGPVVEGF
uniref:Uncharacterized protein n=1 Tax=Pseudomonas graminis TaxID=158627 RepID=A0A7C1X4G2_9PSED